MAAETTPQVYTDVSVDPFVRGFLHHPEKPNGQGLVLTHGAGSNCKAPLLVALAETFAKAGFLVLRCDLPFRQDRPYGPPSPHDGKRDRAGLKDAFAALKNMNPGPVFLGGHSYGGRQASILCAEQPEVDAAALLLLSYPLHPPRKAAQLRTQHFFNLQTPALFVQGTRDPFASVEEIQQALKLIPAKTKLLVVESAGHDLGFKGKARREDLPGKILEELRSLL
ncbi:MAG: alpha/beta fold hydrolase [Candidatus Sulfotelmatobacter sp.]